MAGDPDVAIRSGVDVHTQDDPQAVRDPMHSSRS